MRAWIGDFFRFWWALAYWNARKTWYRLQGGRGVCPCQHPSDSGRAGLTVCEAAAGWGQPARFRRVCPLLRDYAGRGWRCSAGPAAVRPFWRRAFAWYGGVALSLYLAGVVGLLAVMRSIGYAVRFADLAWPPAWAGLPAIRARLYVERARTALAGRDVTQAVLWCELAREADARQYETTLLLAQLKQYDNPTLSDRLFRELLEAHPEHAEATARAWLPVLLARGDCVALQRLAAARLSAAGAVPQPGWTRALLFAWRSTSDIAGLRRLVEDPAMLSLHAATRAALGLALRLEGSTPATARELLLAELATARSTADGFRFYHACEELTTRGFAAETLAALARRPAVLPDRDYVVLRFSALSAQGEQVMLLREVEQLLAADRTNPALIELLGVHLIRHSDLVLLATLVAHVTHAPLPETAANYPTYLTLFCAAALTGDREAVQWAFERVSLSGGESFKAATPVARYLAAGGRGARSGDVLPLLQGLPLDALYALNDRLAQRGPTVAFAVKEEGAERKGK